ncbi:hypothetical protein P7K49_036795, partial [Saguinus oedipus]
MLDAECTSRDTCEESVPPWCNRPPAPQGENAVKTNPDTKTHVKSFYKSDIFT